MNENQAKAIVIIGGGFCGMMTAVHLIRNAGQPLKIVIFNSGYVFGKGVAYSAHTHAYLLNVRAINMSVFPDDKEHFLNWLYPQEKYPLIDSSLVSNIYAPRKKYGEYLLNVWEETLAQKNKWINVEVIQETATDINKTMNGYEVIYNGGSREADYIVLATGNDTPRNVPIAQEDFYTSEKYFPNPWVPECTANVQSLRNILIIGNGLTMIDTVLGLVENGFKGTIYTVSPKGYNLLPHKYNLLVYNKILEELPEEYSLLNVFSLIHTHAKRLAATGIGVHLIIDALRPHAQNIWQSFSLKEKKVFLEKLSPYWNALRHRIPLHIFERIQEMRINKRMIPYAGKLIGITDGAAGALATIYNKLSGEKEILPADRVINCTGPEANITRSSNPLISKLAGMKIILPDELRMGIHADAATGSILNQQGEEDNTLFTIGGNLKGVLFESTAVPELRVQAQNLARIILKASEKNEGMAEPGNAIDNNYIE